MFLLIYFKISLSTAYFKYISHVFVEFQNGWDEFSGIIYLCIYISTIDRYLIFCSDSIEFRSFITSKLQVIAFQPLMLLCTLVLRAFLTLVSLL